ncbi:helix-turn-helix domain-containing protein [Paenarthrobacter sp. S56]|uniref:helix-turn-helix domain-containing protein n=1 Tax=Paenarthrobacter sp. S56 TaxID=3138179 RepID=UPI00321A403E
MALSYFTSAQAAERLGVTQRQVRNMVQHGQLDSEKAGGLLLISNDSLNKALLRPRRTGRAWGSRVAWAALAMLSGGEAPWLEASERYRLRVSLKSRSVDDLMAAARRRAIVRTFRATPEAVGKIRAHVTLTGASAMRDARIAASFGLAEGSGFVDGYVPLGVADQIASAFLLAESSNGNVTLRETGFEDALGESVPVAAIALDLAESVTAREQSAGRAVLQKLLEEWAAHA